MDEAADLACITETWVVEQGGVSLSQLCPPGYLVQHHGRSEGRGGGVAVVYKSSISLTKHHVHAITGLECLHLVLGQRDRLGILLVYRPPCCPMASLTELTEVVSEVLLRSPRLLVLGDVNIYAKATLSGAAQDFMDAMTTMGLSQRVSGPTHTSGHTLDLVFTTGHGDSDLDVGSLTSLPLSWSDHCLLKFRLSVAFSLCKGGGPIKMVCPRRLMNPNGFQRALGDFPADRTGAPVEALANLWNAEMTRAVDTIAPVRPLLCRAHTAPWYTPELRAMKQDRRRLERSWRRTPDKCNYALVCASTKLYVGAVRAAKKQHFTATIKSSLSRPAELFRVVRGLLHPGPQDMADTLVARCNEFAEHFQHKILCIRRDLDSHFMTVSPNEVSGAQSSHVLLDEFQSVQFEDVDKVLGQVRATTSVLDPCPSWLIKTSKEGTAGWAKEVINASLQEGVVPGCLKEAAVRPLLKKPSLDPEDFNSYRPVANVPFLGKILERVVADQLQALLDETDYLDPFQLGFRPGFGTETALVALFDDLCQERDRGSVTLLILLDLSAAFDAIDHGILLERLAELGVGGTAWQWFHSYLAGCLQKIILGEHCSTPWVLQYGVPQGSVLSPMLFNIYMKPLGAVIRSFGVHCHQYADDTQLYFSFSSSSGEAVDVLNSCLDATMDWMRTNKLRLNPDKTEMLLVDGFSGQTVDTYPVLDGVTLPLKEQLPLLLLARLLEI
ncbi:uncharacterized protein LOC133375459 [Rhineura floridana]|uniref:uncharacterized protein LOC133375459 n=1 Tax=Rhineura floridana TaxID=261503 RepID=UPI002AC88ABC|nr:uncharacterized protein LOC133375459 [Rhineura floridana]